jgi:hypothetical protein
MTNSNNDIEELEELLTELEGQEARIVTPYSEEDDAVTRLMEAPLGDQDWMVQVTALDRRMMSTPQLLSELSAGRISSRTLVWRGGMSDWLPIARVDELSRASAAPVSAPSRAFVNLAPPPPPPPQPSKPLWASPAPSAPLPPPPVAMAPPIGITPAVGLGMASTMVSPGMSSPGLSSPGFGSAPPMGLTPPPPAPAGSGYNLSASPAVSASPSLPPSSQGNTTRPVAIDFSDMVADSDPPLQSKRWVMALSAVAILAVFVTVYSLSSGGGDEAKAAAQPQAVSSLQPAASSAAKEKAAPVAAPAPEAAKADKQEEAEPAPVAAAPAKANDEEEATSRSEESRSASASARQTAQARYSLRSEYRRRSRGGSSAGESSRDDDDAETPARAAPARAAVAAAPAAEEEAPPASEAPVAVAEEVDDAPKSTGKASGSTFNRDAAKAALDEAAAQAKNCRPQGGPSGTGRVQVRYEPSGKVANVAILTSKFDNTTTGSCVRMLFRRAKVPEFTGAPVVVVNKSFEIP